jgi:hypothetical protein
MKLARLLAGMVLSFTMLVATSCGSGSDEKCQTIDGVTCSGGSTIKACCTQTQCKYVYGGKDYPCNGTNCQSAAETVVNLCM